MKQHNNNIMNITMYNALIHAGISEKDAKAAAIEVGKNDVRFITIDHLLRELRLYVDQSNDKLRAEMHQSNTELRADMRVEIARYANKTIYAMIGIFGVGIAIATFILPYIIKFIIG